jgi:predicted GNAT family acetyltransferase
MKLHRFQDPHQFFHQAKDYLLYHEALNNLLLGLCDTLIHNPERFAQKPYLATVEIDRDIVAVAMRISSRALILSQVQDLQAMEIIAQDLHLTQASLPGVNGPSTSAKAFAQAWSSLIGQSYQLAMSLYVLQLEQVQPIFHVPGHSRLGQQSDRQLLLDWYKAFEIEALGSHDSNPERAVEHRLQQGSVYLWENEVPVSMASLVGRTPNGARVSLVYTPPEHRRKGYASACVAALSQTLLNQGYQYCFLFTDQGNPTSNHIYQAIGYQPVGDWQNYSFY